MKLARAAVVLILLCAFAVALRSQQETFIHQKPVRLRHLAGTVVDPMGVFVAYATVELRDAKDHHVLDSTFADGKGKFSFEDRKRGELLEFRASLAGFKIVQYTVLLKFFGNEHLKIVLPPAT